MLSKRTNILFEEQMWQQLTYLAEERKTSVGDLVRSAVQSRYLTTKKKRYDQTKLRALDAMRGVRSQLKKHAMHNINIRELIADGRKY
jgi:predicted DNA-binding ribbon-helix-helix protein